MRRRSHLILPLLIGFLMVVLVFENLQVEFLTEENYLSRERQVAREEIHRELEQDDAMLILSNYLGRRYPTNIMSSRKISSESILLPFLLPSDIAVRYEVSPQSDYLYDLEFNHRDRAIDVYNMTFYSTFAGYRLYYEDNDGFINYKFNVFIDKKSHDIVLFTMSSNLKTGEMLSPEEAVNSFIDQEPIFYNRQYERINRDEGYYRSIVRVPSLNKTYLITFIDGTEPMYILLDYRFADEFYQAMKVFDVVTSTSDSSDPRRIQ